MHFGMKNSLLVDDLKEYLEYKKLYLRENSHKVYRLFGDNLTAFLKENNLLGIQTKKVTPVICEAYKKHILKKYLHPTTRNKELGQMKSFFNQFTKPAWHRYLFSPAQHVELLPKQDSEMHEPFSEQQVAEIIGKIVEKRDYWLLLYIYLIHYTFSRPGREVRLLKVGDIKAKSIIIKPENSKNRRIKTPTITKPVEELIAYLGVKNMPLHYYVFGEMGCPGTILCGRNMYYHRHRQILKELGYDQNRHTLYGWKHTGNIRAIELGINERELQFQNGFRDFKTLEIYVRRLSAYMSTEIYEKFI